MSYLKPTLIVGTAFLDETFARSLLADPRKALANARISLSSDEMGPFLRGAVTLSELAGYVLEWEVASGRAEAPLRVAALERSARYVEAELIRPASEEEEVLAA